MNEQQIIEILTEHGGKLWERGDFRRIYFNADTIAKLGGFEVQASKSGRIAWANVDGERVSNATAAYIWRSINAGRFWFDLTDNTWYSQIPDFGSGDNAVTRKFFTVAKTWLVEVQA